MVCYGIVQTLWFQQKILYNGWTGVLFWFTAAAICFVATGALMLLYVLLVNFRLAEEFRAQAVRDPLTGALNRRGFEQGTARLAALSAHLGQPMAMVVPSRWR